ncbi:vomeronasal type-2 receptor 26-like [Pelobates cultripes]|uniref:Vomeronasal type-2 receptor 26-like n=1 Tax=Pelobates cultripes TaxID=61616 RepID=A0AAD1RK10_PELCU|nr:vomeronasal type-2 receptor 26-like [Pelobates cultripes]
MAVILFAKDTDKVVFMEEMLRQNVTGKIFVASEAWSISNLFTMAKYSSLLSGTIGFSFHSSTIPGFREFFNSIQPFSTRQDPWTKIFWEKVFECKFVDQTILTDSWNKSRLCTGNESIESIQNIFYDISNINAAYNIYNAIHVIAQSLRDMQSCQENKGPFTNGSCSDISFKPWQLSHYIQNVKVKLSNGRELFFDQNGDPPAVYDIINWHMNTDGTTRHVKVGSYDTTQANGNSFLINTSALIWASGQQQTLCRVGRFHNNVIVVTGLAGPKGIKVLTVLLDPSKCSLVSFLKGESLQLNHLALFRAAPATARKKRTSLTKLIIFIGYNAKMLLLLIQKKEKFLLDPKIAKLYPCMLCFCRELHILIVLTMDRILILGSPTRELQSSGQQSQLSTSINLVLCFVTMMLGLVLQGCHSVQPLIGYRNVSHIHYLLESMFGSHLHDVLVDALCFIWDSTLDTHQVEFSICFKYLDTDTIFIIFLWFSLIQGVEQKYCMKRLFHGDKCLCCSFLQLLFKGFSALRFDFSNHCRLFNFFALKKHGLILQYVLSHCPSTIYLYTHFRVYQAVSVTSSINTSEPITVSFHLICPFYSSTKSLRRVLFTWLDVMKRFFFTILQSSTTIVFHGCSCLCVAELISVLFFLSECTNLLIWPLVPVSVCTQSCLVGFRKVLRRDLPVCCFECILCPLGQISNKTDSLDCFKCPWDEWPSPQKDRCLPKNREFLSFREPLGAALVATGVFSSLLPISIFGLFICYKNTPIVKANNFSLSCLLLMSMSLCFLSSLAFIGYPQPEKCLLRQVAFGTVFTLCISCILAKTFMVVFAFMATKPGSSLKKWARPRVSYIIIALSSLLQIILCILWISFAPPFLAENTQTQPGIIIVECNEGSPTAFWSMLGYLSFLATISFIVAFLARRLPDSFNEAKFITFSMLAFLSVWVSYIPASLSSTGKYSVAMEIFAILSSSWALLICMFVPKCFIILFRSDMNSKQHLMGKIKI